MTVILVAHILVSIVLIIVVLMQRSEGGALGIGGGGGGGGGAGGGLMSGRGVAGALVRTTIIFGAIFFITSLGLTTLATKNDRGGVTAIEESLENEFGTQPGDDGLGVDVLEDVLDPDRELDISDDPLAVTPTAPVEQPVIDKQPDDPLADPQ